MRCFPIDDRALLEVQCSDDHERVTPSVLRAGS